MRISPNHTIKLNEHSVDIYFAENILSYLGEIVKLYNKSGRAFIVTDSNVVNFYGDKVTKILRDSGLTTSIAVIKAGEKSKNMNTLMDLYAEFNKAEIGREDLIIALGGGVTGDITGFAAASYMRGIPYIQIPTSFLAQIDSSIGGKTGVDLPFGKNLAGAFYQPKAVIIDPSLLSSLPDKYMKDGMGEATKYGLIRDKQIFDILNTGCDKEKLLDIISRCVKIKAEIVELDEHESNLRMILNFGHTFGHAIEKCMNYEGIAHGAAVGIGMVIASKIGEAAGITKAGVSEQIIKILELYQMPIKTNIDKESLFKAILSDKKRSGDTINFIMLTDIGQAIITKKTIKELREIDYE